MSDCLFRREGDRFVPTELAQGPWSPEALHGGSVASLLAYGVEQGKAAPDLAVTRMTIDLFRAVPKAPLRMETTPVRTGRRIQSLSVSLFADTTEVARATALLLLPGRIELGERGTFTGDVPEGPETLATGPLVPRDAQMTTLPGLHTTIEARRVTEHRYGKGGRAVAWLRFPVRVVEGEETSPVMRVAGTSDFGNGLAHIRMDDGTAFINTDISLYLHREPVGEWICLDVTSAAHDTGIGVIDGVVYDTEGPVGTLVQSILANPGARRERGRG